MRYMSTKDLIKQSIIENFTTDISKMTILIIMLVAIIMGIYIFIVYRLAVNNEFYSKDFNRTVALIVVVTAAVVLAIQSNLVISLGMVGALSIVRFRTAVKNPLDLLFLFWSISTGIICGTGLFLIALVLCVVMTGGLFILGKIESPLRLGLIVVNIQNIDDMYRVKETIEKFTNFSREKSKTIGKNHIELIMEYKTKQEQELVKTLSEMTFISSFSLINYDRENRI